MTLEDALPEIRKGRRFRRKGWAVFCCALRSEGLILDEGDLLTDDYELEPLKVEITREMLAEMWDKHVAGQYKPLLSGLSDTFEDFCKELGL